MIMPMPPPPFGSVFNWTDAPLDVEVEFAPQAVECVGLKEGEGPAIAASVFAAGAALAPSAAGESVGRSMMRPHSVMSLNSSIFRACVRIRAQHGAFVRHTIVRAGDEVWIQEGMEAGSLSLVHRRGGTREGERVVLDNPPPPPCARRPPLLDRDAGVACSFVVESVTAVVRGDGTSTRVAGSAKSAAREPVAWTLAAPPEAWPFAVGAEVDSCPYGVPVVETRFESSPARPGGPRVRVFRGWPEALDSDALSFSASASGELCTMEGGAVVRPGTLDITTRGARWSGHPGEHVELRDANGLHRFHLHDVYVGYTVRLGQIVEITETDVPFAGHVAR